jgi:hypothetical protein
MTRSIGMILLAAFLILYGLATLLPVVTGIGGFPIVLALLAVGAGILILVGR